MDITPDAFEAEVTQHTGLVLVDFWADWCSPCKVIAPQLDRIATENPVKLVKVNAGDHRDFAQAHGVTSLPTLVLYLNGSEVARKIGATGGYPAIKQLIAPYLP